MNTFSASSNLSSYVDAYPASRYQRRRSPSPNDTIATLLTYMVDSDSSSGASSDGSELTDGSADFTYQIETRTPRDDTGYKVDIKPYPKPLADHEDPFISPRLGETAYGEFSEHNKRSIMSVLKDKKNNARRILKAKFKRNDYYSDDESEEEWTELNLPQGVDTNQILQKEARGRSKYIDEAVSGIENKFDASTLAPSASLLPSLSAFDLQAAQSVKSFETDTLVCSVPPGFQIPPDSAEFIRSIPSSLASFVAAGGVTIRLVERRTPAVESEYDLPALIARAKGGAPADGVVHYDVPVPSPPVVKVQVCGEDGEDLSVGVHTDDAGSIHSSLPASPATPDLVHTYSEVSSPTTDGILSPPTIGLLSPPNVGIFSPPTLGALSPPTLGALSPPTPSAYAGIGLGRPGMKRAGDRSNLTPPTAELLTRADERLYSYSTASTHIENDPPPSPAIAPRWQQELQAIREGRPLPPRIEKHVHFDKNIKVKWIEARGTRWRSPSEESDYVEGQWRAEEGWTWVDDTAMLPRHNEWYEFLVDNERAKRVIFFWLR
ncbi:hypothetical protein PENSPDRAFT_281573 [Peniophora sp. CONT]|nr:hypothetical protein PENSPDRAFT_281573 [Peniophora sp. CONT]